MSFLEITYNYFAWPITGNVLINEANVIAGVCIHQNYF